MATDAMRAGTLVDEAPEAKAGSVARADGAAVDIDVRGLYKIFGPRGADFVEAVKGGLTKTELQERHGHVLGLKDINLTMPAGSIQVVMGLSGSGKSTLIRHINRLIDPTAGEMLVGGQDVCVMNKRELREFRRHSTAMVFQKFALLPHRTVVDNVVYGLEIQGVEKNKRDESARHWIDRVGLSGFEDNYPNQLSGGMQQRVGLARALANDAPLLLMDEAFSALDPLIRMDMQTILLDLQQELHKTIVFITHDLDEALRLGDRIAILRDGEIIQQGTGQDIVLRPADGYIENFVKDVNRGRVVLIESVMEPGPDAGAKLELGRGTQLEAAARAMSEANVRVANVLDTDGSCIGHVGLDRTVSAMVRRETLHPPMTA